ncbi:Carbohydrate sulfotransferase 1 [Desmophyllum pertusum]|uniref:Carbohydrate sulfotransferase 1 n=1 Tax=Desmophyllum pertusum TaxID=174260 RepID=A0A9W9ZUP0_9CNID|nr:Carbohydrate sulfotransferase 1 [Desmophyllum pertusum]
MFSFSLCRKSTGSRIVYGGHVYTLLHHQRPTTPISNSQDPFSQVGDKRIGKRVLAEPYQTVERLHGSVAPFNRDYQDKSFQWMQGVFQCKFVSPEHANDLQHYYRKVQGMRRLRETQASVALSSPPFCHFNTSDPRWNLKEGCPEPLDQKMWRKFVKEIQHDCGLPMDEAASNWLDLASHKPKTESEQNAAPWREDSFEGAERWRWKVLPYEISIIEHYCSHVMKLLGYKPLDHSYEMQRNLSVRLLDDDFEALGWLYN